MFSPIVTDAASEILELLDLAGEYTWKDFERIIGGALEDLEQESYDLGVDEGYEEGYDMGHSEGYDEGYEVGLDECEENA
jgi:hypothetical protein